MIDTHSHIYAEEFDSDRAEVIARAKAAGITKIILPNVDSESLPRMLQLESEYPGYCFAAIGLHPTSVKENYAEELAIVKKELERREYVAIGEIGIDLYWDKSFLKEQIQVFVQQIEWALEYKLPVIIHVRDSFRETMDVLEQFRGKGLEGVFHSFTGTIDQAREIIEFGGFYIGINGIVTFKNSGLDAVVQQIDPRYLLLETDAPYLTPAPFRGKRNESEYLTLVATKLANTFNMNFNQLTKITTENAYKLFKKLI
jgi:TatD DNase family protein